MFSVTKEELMSIRKKELFKITNDAWNKSGINSPQNVGYLMGYIKKIKPKTYNEWETYFYKSVRNEKDLMNYSVRFRDYVFADVELMQTYRCHYHNLHIFVYYKMVICRLIYETWLGYLAENEIRKLLIKKLDEDGYPVTIDDPTPENDNKYAVDLMIHYNDTLICGIQIKSENYLKSNKMIVQNTIKSNHKKNEKFTKKYGVPLYYAFYKRDDSEKHFLVNESIVEEIKTLIQNKKIKEKS